MRKMIWVFLGATAIFAMQFTSANVQAGLFGTYNHGTCNPCDAVSCDPCDAVGCDPCDPCGDGIGGGGIRGGGIGKGLLGGGLFSTHGIGNYGGNYNTGYYGIGNCGAGSYGKGNYGMFNGRSTNRFYAHHDYKCRNGYPPPPLYIYDYSNGCGPRAKVCPWFLNGHIETGFFANCHGQKSDYPEEASKFIGSVKDQTYDHAAVPGRELSPFSGNTSLLKNTRLTGGQVNQVYLSMGRAVDGRHGLDIGGTVDFTWGADAYAVQTAGMEYATGHGTDYYRWGKGDYFSAFAQAYAEAEYGQWNVKAGKFYLPFGSSRYKSTDNFFYSWASTAHLAPYVGTGAYATYDVNNRFSLLGGWIQPYECGESSHNNAFLGGFAWSPNKRFHLRYVFAAGKNSRGVIPQPNNYFVQTLVGDYFVQSLVATTQINRRLNYVFEWTHINVKDFDAANMPGVQTSPGLNANRSGYGINNELIYQYNCKWAFGARVGMLHGGEYGLYCPGTLYPFLEDPNTNLYTVGLGANWSPTRWLTVKSEIRHDWTKGGARSDRIFFDDWSHMNETGDTGQFSGGVSAVVNF